MIRYICKHIIRAKIKSLLALAVALFFTFALGMLQLNITNMEEEIERIYAETAVNAEIRMCPSFRGDRFRRLLGDIIPLPVLQNILALDIVRDVYLEGGGTAILIPPSNTPLAIIDNHGGLDTLAGVMELSHFTEDLRGFIGRDYSFNMEIQFASGFDESDFVYTESLPIPLVISRELAEKRSLAPGDDAAIVYYWPVLFRDGEWRHTSARIIGIQ